MDAMSEVVHIGSLCVCVCVSGGVSFFSLCIPCSLENLGQNHLTLSNRKQMIHPKKPKFAEMIFFTKCF